MSGRQQPPGPPAVNRVLPRPPSSAEISQVVVSSRRSWTFRRCENLKVIFPDLTRVRRPPRPLFRARARYLWSRLYACLEACPCFLFGKKKTCSWVNMLWNVNSLHDNSPVSSFRLSSAGRTLGRLKGGRPLISY